MPWWGRDPSGDRAAWDSWIRRAQWNPTDSLANHFLLVPKEEAWASGEEKKLEVIKFKCAPFSDGEP